MIDEKAQELGRLLGQSDEYKTLLAERKGKTTPPATAQNLQ